MAQAEVWSAPRLGLRFPVLPQPAFPKFLSANFTKAEGLAFIFAISFNMPCVSALAATARETHSVKWTFKIGVFYTLAALLIACVVYHIGLLVF